MLLVLVLVVEAAVAVEMMSAELCQGKLVPEVKVVPPVLGELSGSWQQLREVAVSEPEVAHAVSSQTRKNEALSDSPPSSRQLLLSSRQPPLLRQPFSLRQLPFLLRQPRPSSLQLQPLSSHGPSLSASYGWPCRFLHQ